MMTAHPGMQVNKEAGFTLLEVMVVLVILAVVTAIAVLSLNATQSRRARIDMQKFAAVVLFTRQSAIGENQVIEMRFTPYGYRMYHYVPDNKFFLKNNQLKGKWFSYASGQFDKPYAFNHKISVTALHDSKKHYALIYFLPNGTVTPFKLRMKEGKRVLQKIQCNDQGVIT